MADNVPYTPGTGVTVGADEISSIQYQRVKVILGADGTNLGDVNPANPMPVSGTVSVSGPVQISGTVTAGAGTTVVSLTGSALVSGTVSVSGAVAISGTGLVSVVPGVSVVAQVSGTITANNPNQLFTTGTPAASSTALIVIQKPGASVSAQVSGTVSVSGTVAVSMVPGASVSVLNVLNTVVTVLSTVNVAIVAGAGGGGSVTTAAPSISATGQVMWLAGGQGTTANPVVMTGVVQVSAGTTNISGTVSVNTVAVLNTVVTVLSTVNVAIVAGAGGGGSVTTAGPSISATGQVMWIVGGQGTTATPVYVSQINPPAAGGGSVTTAGPSISATGQVVWIAGGQGTTATPIIVTGTVTAGAGTTVISGTVTVNTIAAGFSVNALVTGAVSISAMPAISVAGVVPVTTAASVSVTGLPVWMNPTQQVVVSGLAGHAVSISAIAASQTIGTIVTVLGTQIVSVVPGLSVSAVVSGTVTNNIAGITPVTTAASVSVTGLPVWLNPTQQVSIASVQLQPVCIMLSSTVVGSQTTLLMTVYTGATFVTTAASFWVVPAGKVFRVMAMNLVNVSSAVLSRGQLAVIVGTAAASVSVVATVGVAAVLPYAIQASTVVWNRDGIVADIAAGTTVGVGLIGGTTQSIQGGVISGYLF